jgi:dephospho-CoA kinase
MDILWSNYRNTNPEINKKIYKMFGDFIMLCGSIDKVRLTKAVFIDEGTYHEYNSMILPFVQQMEEDMRRQHSCDFETPLIVEATTLFEHNFQDNYHPVCIAASYPTQVKRLMLRNNLTEAEAKIRISVQVPMARKIAMSELVMLNDDYDEHDENNPSFAERVGMLASQISKRFDIPKVN